MTVIDRLRAAMPGSDAAPDDAGSPSGPGVDATPGPGWVRGAVIGVASGLVSVAVVVAPAYYAWASATPASGSAGDAVTVGAGLWLLASGAQVTDGAATIAMTPLLGLALLALVVRLGVREAMVDVSIEGPMWGGLLPRRLAATLGAWWAGYAAVAVTAAVVAAQGPFAPVWHTVVVPVVVLPLVGIGWALRAVVRDAPEVLGPRAESLRPPDALRRGMAPGGAGLLVLLALGAVVVLGAVAFSWNGVRAVQEGVAAGGVGSVVLVVVQVGLLPNLALWVASFLAGPGFQVVDGATVSWSGAQSGLLPMVPVFGALPQPGSFPLVVPVVCAVALLGVGAFIGRRALRSVARLSRLRTKLGAATAACAVTALGAGLLDAVGGGSLGEFRLGSVGSPALTMTLALFGWLVLGAVLAVLRDAWRLRR